jgi:hypothetical protein
MGFREVSDGGWEVVRPFLPPMSSVGRPRAGDRMVLNGIQLVVGGVSMVLIRLLGVWGSIFKTLASMRDLSVDSTAVEAKKGER